MYKFVTSNMYLGANNREIEEGISNLKNKKIIKDSIDVSISCLSKIEKESENLKYLSQIIDHLCELRLTLCKIERGTVPILIGGDHSISIASVACTLDSFEEVGVVWIDAHADINTDETTNSGNIHGMSVAALLGLGNNALKRPFERNRYLKPDNVIYIGLRDVEEKEKKLIEKLGIYSVSSEQIRKEGIENVMKNINDYLKQRGINDLHISYDLDSADPIEAPGVTTAVPNGITFEETKEILNTLYKGYDVRALDIVEYNPKRDFDDKTALFIKKILQMSVSYF